MIRITNHACDRRKRLGLSKDTFSKTAQKAFTEGVRHCDTVGSLNRYITSLYFKNKTANNVRVYNQYIWLFTEDLLITVYPLVNKYKKVVDKNK